MKDFECRFLSVIIRSLLTQKESEFEKVLRGDLNKRRFLHMNGILDIFFYSMTLEFSSQLFCNKYLLTDLK